MLRIQRLSHNFRKLSVLNGISLDVNPGEIVGLLGPNGAGKTTAFNLMVGLLCVQEGHIILNEKDITQWNIVKRARAGLIYLPQEPCIFSKLTLKDNIYAVLEFHPHLYRQREEILKRVSEQLQIQHLLSRVAGVLSGGERRRLEIARALALSPKFLLLDEPFSGIDPIAVTEIKSIIKDLVKLKIGVLITDHNVRETLQVCHRAYLLNQGDVLVSGNPQTISQSHIARQFYLGKEFEL